MDRLRAAAAIDEFLRAIGRDPEREASLQQTGARVADAYADLCSGYSEDAGALLADNLIAQTCGVIVLRDIAITTTCPHHLMPAWGTATVGYEASGHILGVGAIARLVDVFARRLTLQEQIGEEVAQSMWEHVHPKWVVCRLSMTHSCMTARGDRRHGASLVSVALRGDRDAALRLMGPLA